MGDSVVKRFIHDRETRMSQHTRPTGRVGRADLPLREEILYFCREAVSAGLNFPTQGNISVRLTGVLDGDDAIVITPSDVRYDAMTPKDMLVVALDGTVVEG